MQPERVLLVGFGNPGRGDDGLGPALVERLEEKELPGITLDADYQLSPELVADIAEHDAVVFADADVSGPEPYSFRRVIPKADMPFHGHGLEPSAVVALAEGIYGRPVDAWLLCIRGYAFDEFSEKLSPKARQNLDQAVEFATSVLSGRTLRQAAESLSQAQAPEIPIETSEGGT